MVVVLLIEMVVVGWVVGCLVNVKIISIEKKSEEKKRYLVARDVSHLEPYICPPSVV